MIELELIRSKETTNSTFGAMWHNNVFLCFTIEDAPREVKIKDETRIPQGRYKCVKSTDTRFNAQYKERYNIDWVIRVLDVPGFEGIEIHIGNGIKDTSGCILLNSLIAFDEKTGNFYGEASVTAYKRFYNYIESLNDNEIYLTIRDPKLNQ